MESQHIHEQLRISNSQIAPLVTSEKESKQLERDILEYNDDIAEKLTQLEKQKSENRIHLKTLQEQLAKLNQEILELEEGSSYSISLHNFENEKGILNKEVKRWAFHRTVQLLIDETKQVYEKQRQPHVIKEATRMFHSMTNGEYVQLYAPIGEQRLFVERSDGLKFQPNELSQGTKEQLYFAIRLSLATVHSKQTPFPIFIDDILVNFDKGRRLNAIELIKEMSKQHQIVFFTCHPFMADEISENHFCLDMPNN
ncbi:MAG: ATP-binding protein [Anaerobacillus sp.]|uniref:ATP-binding protein n=1 Tax=Anaerobacillus sp. TaxID=1872506 RepID=UPI00391CD09F